MLCRIWNVQGGLWWRTPMNGYTSVKKEAGIFTLDQCIGFCREENSDDKLSVSIVPIVGVES